MLLKEKQLNKICFTDKANMTEVLYLLFKKNIPHKSRTDLRQLCIICLCLQSNWAIRLLHDGNSGETEWTKNHCSASVFASAVPKKCILKRSLKTAASRQLYATERRHHQPEAW